MITRKLCEWLTSLSFLRRKTYAKCRHNKSGTTWVGTFFFTRNVDMINVTPCQSDFCSGSVDASYRMTHVIYASVHFNLNWSDRTPWRRQYHASSWWKKISKIFPDPWNISKKNHWQWQWQWHTQKSPTSIEWRPDLTDKSEGSWHHEKESVALLKLTLMTRCAQTDC